MRVFRGDRGAGGVACFGVLVMRCVRDGTRAAMGRSCFF